jgi:hypothetical protein
MFHSVATEYSLILPVPRRRCVRFLGLSLVINDADVHASGKQVHAAIESVHLTVELKRGLPWKMDAVEPVASPRSSRALGHRYFMMLRHPAPAIRLQARPLAPFTIPLDMCTILSIQHAGDVMVRRSAHITQAGGGSFENQA